MKIGIIIETKEAEKAWNAMRFANQCAVENHEVKVFLMGEAVEIESINEEPYNVKHQMELFYKTEGEMRSCGTCLKSRGLEGTKECPLSTMADCLNMVTWADKVVTF